MKIIWTKRAVQRVIEISDFIAVDKVSASEKWVDETFAKVECLRDFPELGRQIREKKDPNIREIIHGNYRIVYEIYKGRIEILTVRNFKERRIL